MKKIAFYFLLLSFIVTPALAESGPLETQKYAVQPFNAINISGGVNVIIDSKGTRPFVLVKGDPKTLRYVVVFVQNNTLYLGLKPTYQVRNGYLTIVVCAPQLTNLRYTGSGQVIGKNLKGVLSISNTGTGSMQLRGMTTLQSISFNGSGHMELYWVNSNYVRVMGNGNGKVYLAGVTGLLDVNIGNRTWLDARQLHADRGFIKTTANARADVWVRDSLSMNASDHSNIYYYHDAKFVGGYMTPPGVVLRMVGIDTNQN